MRTLLIFLIAMLFMSSNAYADVYQSYKNHIQIQQITSFPKWSNSTIPLVPPMSISLSYARHVKNFELGLVLGKTLTSNLNIFFGFLGEWPFWRKNYLKLSLGGKIYKFTEDIGGIPYLSARLAYKRWHVSLGVEYPMILYTTIMDINPDSYGHFVMLIVSSIGFCF